MSAMNESQRLFGIVQGRLTASPLDQLQRFPQEAWEEEFFSAANVGIEFIELLTERQYNSNNPVWSDEGRKKIKDLCVESKCSIYSICTDYIIDHSLIFDPDDSTYEHVNMFLHASGDLGCKIAVFPLLEESDLTPESSDLLVPLIKDFAATAAKYGITICIETLLNGENLIAFLEAVDEPNVKAVYDTGNRIIDTLDLDGEIRLLGNKIAHVHVKDKNIEHEKIRKR